jgi:protein-L-isoaspartate(D-aspartate) O-methyltransferase
MNLNYQKERNLMVENQLRPNKIKDVKILSLFKDISKEDFLTEKINSIPYSDSDIDITDNRGYLKNLHIAQIISHSEIDQKHKVLHIGALTGYVTVLLSNLCLEVVAIEENNDLRSILKKNIDHKDIKNIKVVGGSLKTGFNDDTPYDRIIIDNPIKKIDSRIYDQLSDRLGKIIMVKKIRDQLNQAYRITKNEGNLNKEYLFDVFSKYELYQNKEEFIF